MAVVRHVCGFCGARMRVPFEKRGARVKCPKCGEVCQVALEAEVIRERSTSAEEEALAAALLGQVDQSAAPLSEEELQREVAGWDFAEPAPEAAEELPVVFAAVEVQQLPAVIEVRPRLWERLRQHPKELKIGAAWLAGVFGILLALMWYSEWSRKVWPDDAEAVPLAHVELEKYLLAPATAVYLNERVVSNGSPELPRLRVYSVFGDVDASNRFGVPLRCGFEVTLVFDRRSRNWTPYAVKLGEDTKFELTAREIGLLFGGD